MGEKKPILEISHQRKKEEFQLGKKSMADAKSSGFVSVAADSDSGLENFEARCLRLWEIFTHFDHLALIKF